MKKTGVLFLSVILFLPGCSTNEEGLKLVEWVEYSPSQEWRLNKNSIQTEVKDDMIYIEEKDLDKAVDCCS